MDLYLTESRRRPAPLGLAVVAIIGMIIWAFTAQGKAAAASADRPSETAHRLDNLQAVAIEDADDLNDVNADDGESDSDSSAGGGGGGSDTSAGGGGGGDDSSDDGTPPPGGNNPPPGGNNPPSGSGVLGGNPPTVVLPNTAISAEGGTSTGLVAGLVVLAAAGATGLRRFVGLRVQDR